MHQWSVAGCVLIVPHLYFHFIPLTQAISVHLTSSGEYLFTCIKEIEQGERSYRWCGIIFYQLRKYLCILLSELLGQTGEVTVVGVG